jgi:DNA-binding transcriptional MocR family regulator
MSDPTRFIARHVVGLPRSGIRDFFDVVAKMKSDDVISLGIGEPDFRTPWHIREAAIYSLERGRTHYTANLGLIELRRAISGYVGKHFGIGYRPESEVLVTVGVSEALDLAFRAFMNPGEKVLFHQPCYVSYHPSVTLVHGQGIPVPTFAKDNFALTAEALAAAWQPGCRILSSTCRAIRPAAPVRAHSSRRSRSSPSRRTCSSSATRYTPSSLSTGNTSASPACRACRNARFSSTVSPRPSR